MGLRSRRPCAVADPVAFLSNYIGFSRGSCSEDVFFSARSFVYASTFDRVLYYISFVEDDARVDGDRIVRSSSASNV